MAPASLARQQTEEAFLDAAERLLVSAGHAGMTTRALAQEAGANHGLVHYYFGSMENLLARVLERFTERMIARQRSMYAAPDVPFGEKWRTAMRYLDADRDFFVDFHDRPGGPARAHEIRLQGGDCTTEIFP